MNLVADEGVDRQIVERLRDQGHEVVYIAELEPGIEDELVLARAERSGALLLTADKDFGEIVFRQTKLRGGVVLLRLAGLGSDRKALIVSAALDRYASEMAAAFSVVAPGSVRIRRREI